MRRRDRLSRLRGLEREARSILEDCSRVAEERVHLLGWNPYLPEYWQAMDRLEGLRRRIIEEQSPT